MPIFLTGVGTNLKVQYGGTDLTSFVRAVTINYEYDDVDITAAGATAKAHLPGLRDDSIDIEFYQGYGTTEVDQTLNTYLGSTTGATLVVQSSSATVNSTNPKWSMLGTPFTYNPMDGNVGDASTTKVTFKPVAGQAITRGTV